MRLPVALRREDRARSPVAAFYAASRMGFAHLGQTGLYLLTEPDQPHAHRVLALCVLSSLVLNTLERMNSATSTNTTAPMCKGVTPNGRSSFIGAD